MPPRELYLTRGAVRKRQILLQTWQQLTDARRHLYKKGLKRRDLAAHMHQTRSFIPFAGKSWLRRVYRMSKAWWFPYSQKECMVYAVVNDLNGHVYVGQIGGREQLRYMVQRFKEHILGGINFERKKHRYEASGWSLYEGMHKLGAHHFFVVPLEVVDKCVVDAREHGLISRFSSEVYNRMSEARWCSQRNLKEFFPKPSPLPRGNLTHLANRYVQMRSPQLPEMLNLWTCSQDRLPQPLRRSLWDRLVTVSCDTHGIKVPLRLVFPHPSRSQSDLQDSCWSMG